MKTKVFYVSPMLSVLELRTEGLLCASGDKLWYEQGGQGDFTYGTDTDGTWA